MLTKIIFVPILYYVFTASHASNNWKDFFKDRMEVVGQEMKQDFSLTHIILNSTNVQESRILTSTEFKSGHIFKLFKKFYILLNTELFNIMSVEHMIISSLKQLTRVNSNVSCVRAFDYKDKGFVAVAYYDEYIDMFGLTPKDEDFKYIQTIQTKGYSIDMVFYYLNDSYFFFPAGTLNLERKFEDDHAFIYKWLGSHFDLASSSMFGSFGTNKILTFSDNGTSQFLISAEHVKSNKRLLLIVMEFFYQENNYYTIPRQVLLVKQLPLSIVTYVQVADRYVVYFQPDVTLVFLYDGRRLFKINSFPTPLDFQMAVASHVSNLPLIFVAQKANLLGYQPKNLKAEEMRLMMNVTFKDPFASVTDMYVINDAKRDYIVITGFDLDKNFIVTGISLELDFFTEKRYPANSELLQCMRRLHSGFGEYDVNLREIKRNRKNKRNSKLNETDPYVGDYFDDPYFLSKEHVELILSIEKLQENIKKVKRIVDSFHETKKYQLEEKVINGTLKVNRNLQVGIIRAQNINLNSLSGIVWSPKNWLSYTKPQRITSACSFKVLNTKQLYTTKERPFKDMLLQNGNQKITGAVSATSLNAQKIFTNKINSIPFHQIYLRKLPTTIKGRKQFDNLVTDSIKTNQINQKNASSVVTHLVKSKSSHLNFGKTVVIQNLQVEELNNIHWNSFKDSVFKIGRTVVINGSLKIENFTTNQLQAKILTGYKVDELFTIKTNQHIYSTFQFAHVHAENITAFRVNGIDIELEAAKTTDIMNEIKGPVCIANMRVYGEMLVKTPSTLEKLKTNDLSKHENSFLQLYNKKVKILGNVRLQNVDVPGTVKFLTNGTEFNSETLKKYWLKHTHQVIPNHVEALEGITTPHLTTRYLNNVKLNKYLLNNLEDKPSIKMYFENVTILGNVHLNKNETHVPNLEKLIEEAVKLNGSYEIRGNKTIKGRLEVKNLFTFSFNDINPRNAVTTNTTDIIANYTFENLEINGEVNSNQTKFENINKYDIKSLLNNTIFVDENVSLEELNFDNVTAKNMYISMVNTERFKDYVEAVDDLFGMKVLKNVSLFMDAKLTSVTNITTINNVEVKNLKSRNFDHEKKTVIFNGPVRAKHFQAVYINNIDFNDLSRNLFYRFWPQNVSGYHTFKYLYAKNLRAPQVNDLRISNIVNIRDSEPQHLRVDGLVLQQTKFLKSVYAKWMRCDVHQAASSLKHPQTRIWNSIYVQQNATVWDESSSVYHILNNAVSAVKTNIITEPVIFNNICANSATSTDYVNNIDIVAIAKDAVLLKGHNQIVGGHKIFSELTAAGAYAVKNADIPVINKIIISKLNESIISKKDLNKVVIKGTKTFYNDFQTTYLYSKTVSGINPEMLVSLDNLYMIPKTEFKHLKISNNFNINFVNNIDLKNFLSKRVLKNYSEPQELNGVYYFNTVQLNEESSLPTINKVNLDEVIFDDGLQVINSSKQFLNDVKTLDNVKIGLINNYNISDRYERAILFEENVTISSNVQLNTISEVTANITTTSINGIQISDIKQMLNTSAPIIKANIINETIKKIENLIVENLNEATKLPQQYLYLEKSSAFQIKLPKKIISAQAVNTKEHVIIHAIGEESADSCGLPKSCSCPVQYTIHITPTYAVNYFPKSVSQKIYSYDDGEMTVHIISNSLNSIQACRNSSLQLNDQIEISWNRNVQNATKHTYKEIINGYISDVQFFSLDGYTYAVLSRSSDPLWNRTDLSCLLIIFSKEKDKIEDIKKIDTTKASSLYVLHTAQGVNLIVANSNEEDNIDSDIFRFNPIKQEFYLLRTIPSSGCKSVAGVVLGRDSLIILAQKRGTVQVLKYYPESDNYYFFQSFKTDSPVISVSSFYLGNFGISDAYLSIVTETNQFYLFSFAYFEGWKLMSRGELNGLQSFVPFMLKKQPYLFAPSEEPSNLLTVAKQG